jgi:hypothetical protein
MQPGIKTNPCGSSTNSGIASAATALSANVDRKAGRIQNLGTNVLFVKLGSSASTSDFTVALQAGSANDDGKGGFFDLGGYHGIVTIAGTSPRYVASEDV